MSKVVMFAPEAWGQYKLWADTDKRTTRKINRLIDEIDRMGNEGAGKPEALVGDLSGYWSRRINEKDRLVYKVDENAVYILSCATHYGKR